MHCASCSAIIEKTFKKVDGVHSVEVNYGTEKAKISFDESKVNSHNLSKRIEPLGYSLEVSTAAEMGMSESEHAAHLGLNQSKKEKLAEIAGMKTKIATAVPIALFSIFVMGWDIFAKFGTVSKMSTTTYEFVHHLLPILATYILFIVGKPYLLGFYRFLRYGKANMDTLIGIGTSVAYFYSFIIQAFEESLRPFINIENTYYDVTIIVITFIALGKYLEARSKLKTGDAIEKLLNLQAKTALVIRNGKEQETPVDQVVHNDLIIIKPGAKIPVDGIIIEGSSFIDEAMVTGEPMPAGKQIGDTVIAGTINTTGSFTFKATKVGSETLLAHIIKMVEEAQGSRAPIQALADKISSVFVPIVLALSFITLGVWLIVGTQYLGFSQALSYGLTAFVGILVIACPCALGLATPTAIIVGVGKGAREGILIKDAATLEKLYRIDTVVADKTGTLTQGKPQLTDIIVFDDDQRAEIISLAASLEQKSEHPLALAILQYAASLDQKSSHPLDKAITDEVVKEKIKLYELEDFKAIPGKGLRGFLKIQSQRTEAYLGNRSLMADIGLDMSPYEDAVAKLENEGKTVMILAVDKKIKGALAVADVIKKESIEAVRALKKNNIDVWMITGDNDRTARAIAAQAGISNVMSEVLPDKKSEKVRELQNQGKVVAMIGDGINDAPALAQADVGIAMGTGTDVAIETAGITLLHGDISKLVKTIKLSKMTMRGIKQNLFWAFIYNIVGIPVAAGVFYPVFGWLLSPVFAGFAMAMSSVSVVTNSLRIKGKRL